MGQRRALAYFGIISFMDWEQPNLDDRVAVRRVVMLAVVGLWKGREDIGDADEYVRELRKDARLERLK